MAKEDIELAEHMAHFPPITKALIDWVNDTVLRSSRYLFLRSVRGIQSAYCTHCNKLHYPESKLKHKEFTNCPHCNSRCMTYLSHVGRKYLRDNAYVVYYQKSVIDPTVVTAMGFYVARDYCGSYQNVQTLFHPSSSYVFSMGKSEMYERWGEKWYKRKNLVSEFPRYQNIRKRYNREHLPEVLDGTPLQYSTWQQYDEQDMTKFFALYSKYPCIEYLTKMNMNYFVKAKLCGFNTFDAINWRGKTVEQLFRLKKQDLKRFKTAFPTVYGEDEGLSLRLFQLTLKDSDRPLLEELKRVASDIFAYWGSIKPMFKFQSVTKSIRYVDRQFQRGKGKHYHNRCSVLTTWNDYFKQCKALEFDISRNDVVFPYDLHKEHESASAQLEILTTEKENRKVLERAKELEAFSFAYNGYIIRPPMLAQEIVNEGKKLRHCVGQYAKEHADGKTSILLIRKAADPDEPFYTIEIRDRKVRQCHGYRNCWPKADIAELVEKFKEAKLNSRARKKSPPERQEVAV